jgi:hypothetical protein
MKDDLGGHCHGLTEAFYPSAKFICCRENPANLLTQQGKAHPTSTTTTTTTTTTLPPPTTEIVTEVVTQTETFTEVVTRVEEVTDVQMVTEITMVEDEEKKKVKDKVHTNEKADAVKEHDKKDKSAGGGVDLEEEVKERIIIETEVGSNLGVSLVEGEVLRPGVVIDDPTLVVEIMNEKKIQAQTADLVLNGDGLQIQVSKKEAAEDDNEKAEVNCDDAIECEMSLGKEEKVEGDGEYQDLPKKTLRKEVDDEDLGDVIKTTKIDFEPERDELLAAVSKMKEERRKMPSDVEERPKISSFRGSQSEQKGQQQRVGNVPEMSDEDEVCGQLGGRDVFEAFGRAAEVLLPDLVANWVTGHPSHKMASEYIGGGAVTSTVIYCWMAAIVKMEVNSEGEAEHEQKEFLCTGTLVRKDLVVTSASCAIQ